MYDIIGDIHGHADELVELLGKLGYSRSRRGAFRHPGRTAVFVGDLIDRGPKVREVVEMVREMVAAGSALVVLGNHEWNALGWHTADPDTGTALREHSAKNRRQHAQTLEAYEGPRAAPCSTRTGTGALRSGLAGTFLPTAGPIGRMRSWGRRQKADAGETPAVRLSTRPTTASTRPSSSRSR